MMGFNNIIGHEEIIGHLKNAIESGKISHSYIFTGEPGSGKKLLAGTFASTLQSIHRALPPEKRYSGAPLSSRTVTKPEIYSA